MNKTTRYVFRLSVIASKIRRLPINTARTCYTKIPAGPYSSNSKDHGLPAESKRMEYRESDEITTILSTVKTSEDIFKTIRKYRTLMKGSHALQALSMLDSMYRQVSVTDSSIGKKVEFLQLLEIVISNMKSLDVNNAAYILKVCTYFGVPSTSVITQSLLQLIRQSLSHLSLHRLMDLQFQLKNFNSTPLSDALLIAIPIMCEIHLNNKMIDLNSTTDLVQAVLFLANNRGSRKTTEIIIDAVRAKGTNIHVIHAKKMFQYMCRLHYLPPGYRDVVFNLQQIIIQNIHQCSSFETRLLLSRVVKQVRHRKNQDFYNEEFVDACAEVTISQDFGFEDGVKILRALYNLNHTNIRLIDYLAAKCFENSNVLSESPINQIAALVNGMAMADYKPIFWESMQDIIAKKVAKKDSETRTIHMDFVISMTVLDLFDIGVIKKVFKDMYMQSELWKKTPDAYWNLLLLYQSVKTFFPQYTGPWPSQQAIDTAINNNSFVTDKPSLLPALERALGGSQYVLSNLRSKIGHQIDYVVTMRKGGYPVALNSLQESTENEPNTYIEDLQLPAKSQVIIIIYLPAYAYAINSRRLKGTWTLLLKTLETHTKHTVIPISSMMWTGLQDYEKIPYLMQAIRLKCDDISASANVW